PSSTATWSAPPSAWASACAWRRTTSGTCPTSSGAPSPTTFPAAAGSSDLEGGVEDRSGVVLGDGPGVRLPVGVRLRESDNGIQVVVGEATGGELARQPERLEEPVDCR